MSAGVFPITLPDQPNEMVFGSPRALSFEPSAHDGLSVRHIEIDFRSFSVQGRSQLIALTRVEFDILAYLVAARRVVSSRELVTEVIKSAHQEDSSLVRVHISHLRRKLAADGADLIVTVRGRGYLVP